MIRSMVIFSFSTLAVLTVLAAALSYARVIEVKIRGTDVPGAEYVGLLVYNGRITAIIGEKYTPTQARTVLPKGTVRRLGFEYTVSSWLVKLATDPDDRLEPFVHREVSGPAWAVVIAFATYPAIAFIRGPLRRRRRRKRGLCPTCGYNLTGNTSGVCPECSAKVEG